MTEARSEYRRALGAALAAALYIGAVAGLLVPIGAIGHLRGMVANMCDTFTHMMSDVASLMLLALAVSAVVGGLLAVTASAILELRIRSHWREATNDVSRRARSVARRGAITARLVVFASDESIACSRGLLRPSIWISDAGVSQLTDDELLAVLIHEQHHCDQRDPARLHSLRVLARAFFAFPLVDAARLRFQRAAEFAADDAARAGAGSRETALALLKFATAQAPPVVAQFGETTIAERVQRLVTEQPVMAMIDRRATAITTAIAVVAAACLMVVACLPTMG